MFAFMEIHLAGCTQTMFHRHVKFFQLNDAALNT